MNSDATAPDGPEPHGEAAGDGARSPLDGVPAYQTGYLPAADEEQVRAAWAAHGGKISIEPRLPWRTQGLVALAVAVVIGLLGFPLGWLWSSVAPWLPVSVSGGNAYYAEPESEQLAGQESWFMIITVIAGIVLAILAWLVLRRFRGIPMVVALTVGSLVAGWLTWRFGHNIGRGHAIAAIKAARDGATVLYPPNLRIRPGRLTPDSGVPLGNFGHWHGIPYVGGVLVYMALAAAATYTLITLVTSSPTLDRYRTPPVPDPEPTDAPAA